MSYAYDAGTSVPTIAGLVEYGGIRINDGTFRSLSMSGLRDSPGVRQDVTPYAQAHGATLSQALYDARLIQVGGVILVSDIADLPAAEEELRAAFNLFPSTLQTLTVAWAGLPRQIMSVRVAGPLVFDDPDVARKKVPRREFMVTLVAPDPRRYSETERSTVATLNGAGTLAQNAGTFPAVFGVRITGPITNPSVVSAAGTFGLTTTIVAGTYVDLNTDTRTAVDSTGASRYGSFTGAWYEIPPGGTSINVTGTGTSGATVATVTHRDCWV